MIPNVPQQGRGLGSQRYTNPGDFTIISPALYIFFYYFNFFEYLYALNRVD